MDWRECMKKRFIKDTKLDQHKINSFKQIIEVKIKSADYLPDNLYYSKITLLYDALRILLEVIALDKGYKVYNHECYTSFLKEIFGMSREADIFDRLRKIRNGINYYGKEISEAESKDIIETSKDLIKRFEKFV